MEHRPCLPQDLEFGGEGEKRALRFPESPFESRRSASRAGGEGEVLRRACGEEDARRLVVGSLEREAAGLVAVHADVEGAVLRRGEGQRVVAGGGVEARDVVVGGALAVV